MHSLSYLTIQISNTYLYANNPLSSAFYGQNSYLAIFIYCLYCNFMKTIEILYSYKDSIFNRKIIVNALRYLENSTR